jgi:hypothetical protein
LAAIGYSLSSLDRKRPKAGLGWSLLRILGWVVDLASIVSTSGLAVGGAAEDITRGRLIAKFDLRSPTHAPIEVPADGIAGGSIAVPT